MPQPAHHHSDSSEAAYRPSPPDHGKKEDPIVRDDQNVADNRDNIFLSELLGLRGWTRSLLVTSWGKPLAIAFFVWSLLTIILGGLANCLCITATIRCTSCGAEDPIKFGYWSEPNHAAFQLIVAPILVILFYRMIHAAYMAFYALERASRLSWLVPAVDEHRNRISVVDFLAKRNGTIFKLVIPFALVGSLLIVGIGEYRSFSDPMFGWVQSTHVQDLVGKHLKDLRDRHHVEELPHVGRQCEAKCKERRVGKEGDQDEDNYGRFVISDISRKDGPTNNYFWPFLLSALGLQWISMALGWWMAAKILFIIGVAWSGLRKPRALASDAPRSPVFQIRMNLFAKDARLGLRRFDAVYNYILAIAAQSSLGFCLGKLSNAQKGSSAFSPHTETLPFIGQIAVFVTILAVSLIMYLFPAIVFVRLAESRINRKTLRIERLLGLVPSKARRKVLEDLQTRIETQSPWPKKDKIYAALTTMLIAFLLLLPFSIAVFRSPSYAKSVMVTFWNVTQGISPF